jgi:glutathione reductase (NADPH)
MPTSSDCRAAFMEQFDLLVVGGGSGGLACAQRAAEYGARVALVESGRLGGTCVNVGCVPKKIMWNASEIHEALADGVDYGFPPSPAGHDWPSLKAKRDAYVQRLNGMYARSLASRKIEHIEGRASFIGPQLLTAAGRTLGAAHIVIATGGRPLLPSIPGAPLGITSDGFFELAQRPERVAVAGSGYIAVELAGILAGLGSKVVLVIRGHEVLRQFDALLGQTALLMLREMGVAIESSCRGAQLLRLPEGTLELELHDGRRLGPLDTMIWAVGRVPNVEELALSRAGVHTDPQGFIATDEFQATNAAGIYAVGDVTGRIPLTPVAIAAGRRLSDRLFGGQPQRRLDYDLVPTVIFGHPPIGSIGVSEAQARARHGSAVRVYTSSFVPLYHAMTVRKPHTHMKLVTVGEDERIVGAHVIGPGADEMLQGFAVALRMGARKRDFDDTVAIHPTSAEEFVTMR